MEYVFFRLELSAIMIKIKARGGESIQQMMKRFKKLCEKEGLIKDIKKQSYYEKPSEKRRRTMAKARINAARALRENS